MFCVVHGPLMGAWGQDGGGQPFEPVCVMIDVDVFHLLTWKAIRSDALSGPVLLSQTQPHAHGRPGRHTSPSPWQASLSRQRHDATAHA
jgi:hypothetical protein